MVTQWGRGRRGAAVKKLSGEARRPPGMQKMWPKRDTGPRSPGAFAPAPVQMAVESRWTILTRDAQAIYFSKIVPVDVASRLVGGQEETCHIQLGGEGSQDMRDNQSDQRRKRSL